MKAYVYVSLKKSVLDPQGKTIQSALKKMGCKGLEEVRQGKYFELTLDGGLNRSEVLTRSGRAATKATVRSASVTSASPTNEGTSTASALVIATVAARLPKPAVSTSTRSAVPALAWIRWARRVSSASATVSNAAPS